MRVQMITELATWAYWHLYAGDSAHKYEMSTGGSVLGRHESAFTSWLPVLAHPSRRALSCMHCAPLPRRSSVLVAVNTHSSEITPRLGRVTLHGRRSPRVKRMRDLEPCTKLKQRTVRHIPSHLTTNTSDTTGTRLVWLIFACFHSANDVHRSLVEQVSNLPSPASSPYRIKSLDAPPNIALPSNSVTCH